MSFVDWEAWAPDDDERALAVQKALDDQQDQWDREDREAEKADLPRLLFDQPRLGLAPRERQVNRRAVEDVVIGGLLTAATLTSLVLMAGLVLFAVELTA